MRIARTLALICCFVVAAASFAQTTNQDYRDYIEQYKHAAIYQMHKYHIPASITLSQALLESAAGKSDLARKANNHFGIKVSSGWTGPYTTHDDDKKGERFRKYDNVAQSYEDHSQFLLKDRYKRLFQLDPLDYQGWARGLKECGYATNPAYAQSLISLIERYNLNRYDEDKNGKSVGDNEKSKHSVEYKAQHKFRFINGKMCLTALPGDTWTSISKEMKVPIKKLLKYNEVEASHYVTPGTNIFLEKKAKKAEKAYKGYWHKVMQGESMYDISQRYGVRLKNLYKMNFKAPSYVPVEGDLIRVRN